MLTEKEYVCVKVDKRLAELIRKKQRQRAQRAAALEKRLAKEGGLWNSKGDLINVTLQPTLPKIKLDDDEMSLKGMRADTSRTGKSMGMSMGRSGSTDALGAFGAYLPLPPVPYRSSLVQHESGFVRVLLT
jgi:hypothetical protein